jgi:hypothetical protein
MIIYKGHQVKKYPHFNPLPSRGCVVIGGIEKNVMLNLVQHLTKSRT